MKPGLTKVRQRLRRKLFLAYSIPVSLILILSNIFIISLAKKTIQRQMETEMLHSVELVKGLIESSLDISIRNHLKGIAEKNKEIALHLVSLSERGGISEQEAKKTAEELFQSQTVGKTGYIFVWDISEAPRNIILAVHPQLKGENVAHIDFVKEGVKIKNGYLHYFWKNPDEFYPLEKSMYLAYVPQWDWVIAVSSYKSEFINLISIEDFKKQIAEVKFGKSGHYYVMDTQGNMIYHPFLEGNYLHLKDPSGKPFILEMCQKQSGSITYSTADKTGDIREKYSVYTYLSTYDWILASSSFLDEYNQPLNFLSGMMISLSITMFCLILIISLISGRLILKPLTALTEAFQKGALGDYSIQMDITSRDEIGELSRCFNIFMATLRQNREELIYARQYLGNILDSLPSMLISVNRQGYITQWNLTAEKTTGIPPNKALGVNVFILLPALEKYREQFLDTGAQTGKENFRETLIFNGEKRHFSISVFHQIKTESGLIVIRLDDITELITKDEQLLRAQKMETVGNLAGGLAHDFNNVLGGIIGTITLIRHILENGTDVSEITGYLDIIASSAARTTEMIEQLLSLSRRIEPALSVINLNDLLKGLLPICSATFDKRVRIVTNYYKENAFVLGSGAQLEQVFINLLINSHDAATIMRPSDQAPGGIISVSVGYVVPDQRFKTAHPETEEGKEYWAVVFADTGVGISQENLKKIFDPFFTTKEKGSGLGLSMAYNILKQHKGFMSIVSEPNKGSTFTVYIPSVKPEKNPKALPLP